MKLIFKVGDVVYVPTKGRGVIMATDRTTRPYCVKFDDNESGWFQEGFLSFEPWPAPVHVRPIEVGWYVVWIPSHFYPSLYHWNGNKWNNTTLQCSMENMMSCNPKMKYLGEELKHD